MKLIEPPHNPLDHIFTPETISAWEMQYARKPSQNLHFRLEVLKAHGPYPVDLAGMNRLREFRAWKAAWETYLYSAFACGRFEGEKGLELRGRLTSADDDDFRSAISECLTCWFLAGQMKFPINPTAPGRNGKMLDMNIALDDGDVGIEVKTPFREPLKDAGFVDDSDKIDQSVQSANRQFSDDKRNILVLIPSLQLGIIQHREIMVKALFGQTKITFPVNPQTGESGPIENKFFPDGKFFETRKPSGGPLKSDGLPAYRRISAVLCIEEGIIEKYPAPDPFLLLDEKNRHMVWPYWEKARDLHNSRENKVWIGLRAMALHNPYAYHPIPEDIFDEFPQFVTDGDKMKWTDGYRTRV